MPHPFETRRATNRPSNDKIQFSMPILFDGYALVGADCT